MDYQQTVDYLFKQLPMFHRIGAAAYKADLNNIKALSEHLHHPENKITSIHIAGTNGKGSVSNMLASILQESGYKTGLFTSPHLKDFRERIRIDGEMIGESEVIRFVEENKKRFEEISPSFFEWTTALALEHFAKEKVDIAIIETGLGGRLDSTNIITPVLSVITNISYDHMQFLGDTLEKIAGEKAGIIKQNIPVVIGERQKESENVFINQAKGLNAPIFFASDFYKATFNNSSQDGQSVRVDHGNKIRFENLQLWLTGKYQLKNICTVLQSLDLLKNNFPRITDQTISAGLTNGPANTGFLGRWQIIATQPRTIADIGHNEAGIKLVMDQLAEMDFNKLHIVFGMVNDKDPSKVLSLLPKHAQYYFCKANLPRSLDQEELKKLSLTFGLSGDSYESVAEAFKTARKNAGEKDVVFVGGSTFVVAEVI